jgi:hypothetical protein
MNKQLYELYSSKWSGLSSAIKQIIEDDNLDIKPTSPLLIYIDKEEEFQNADIRVMIYGQETNGWFEGFYSDIKPILDCYDNFFNGGECWNYGGHFWNGVKKFRTMLEKKYQNNKKIRYIWNNIVKIGKSDQKGFPPDYIYEVERNHFSVIKDELQIIKPNVVLFLTGPFYDSVIADNFGQLKYTALSPFSNRELSRVELSGIDFAFRTYHPNFLWHKGLIDSFFERIINEIKL